MVKTNEIKRIADRIARQDGRAFFVGGMVRDTLLGVESKDIDIEVFGIDMDTLISVLKPFGRVEIVGQSFGVLKLSVGETDFDFSLPRRESKVGKGHKGFKIEVDPSITFEEAASRRDFTFNAMMQSVMSEEIVDFFGGQQDIENRVIRATSEHFAEDALRVLRGMQFAGRFEMTVEPETAKMCKGLVGEFSELATERVWREFEKWAKSAAPSFGIQFLIDTGWVGLFPEIAAMVGLEQDRAWHPEGSVISHSMLAVDVAAQIADRETLDVESRIVLVFAALCHDMGKATTTTHSDRIRSKGHAHAGAAIAESFMTRIGAPREIVEQVVVLVKEHMVHVSSGASKRMVRRLSVRVQPSSIEMLVMVMECDHSARGFLQSGMPREAMRILEIASEMQCVSEQVQPLVMGRHLIEMGMVPGREFGVILKAAFEAQLEGEFSTVEAGMEFVKGL